MSNMFNRNVVDRSFELTAKVCVPYMRAISVAFKDYMKTNLLHESYLITCKDCYIKNLKICLYLDVKYPICQTVFWKYYYM